MRPRLIYATGHDVLFLHYPDGTLDEFPCPLADLEEHLRVIQRDMPNVDLAYARPMKATLLTSLQMRLATA